jgi:pimeloyl-ACP methyl ester carboxylesterase
MLGKEFFTSMRQFHVYDNIGSFSGPVLILYGDRDGIVPLSACQKAAKEYAQAKIVILPGEGHGFSPSGAKTAMEKAFEFMNGQYHP